MSNSPFFGCGSKYRILLLNTLLEPGGAQKAMFELAKGLQARGHSVTTVTMYDKGGFASIFEERYGIRVVDLKMKPARGNALIRAKAFILGLWRFYRLLREERIQILQTFTHYSNIIGPVIAWCARVPVRISSQRNTLKSHSRFVRWMDQLVANSQCVHMMTCVSEQTRKYCLDVAHIRGEKLMTIPNGVAVPDEHFCLPKASGKELLDQLGVDADQLVVLIVARLHPQKGHRYLIEAIPRVLEDVPNAVFLFAGEGELRGELSRLIKDAGVGHATRLLGARDDIPSLLEVSDLFVLPSLWEGMPNAVLEAMAYGLPVVATCVDGTTEVVEDGRTGILVPPKDVSALADAIVRFLKDRELRLIMGNAGRMRVIEEFSIDSFVDRHVALYDRLARQTMV